MMSASFSGKLIAEFNSSETDVSTVESAECSQCKSAAVIDRRSTRASVEDWHRRMGHLNLKDLSTSYRDGTVLGMDIIDPERVFKCEVCIRE